MTTGEQGIAVVHLHHPSHLVREALMEAITASVAADVFTSDTQATLEAALEAHQPTVVILAVPSHSGYRRNVNRTVEMRVPHATVIEIPRYLDHPHDETRLAEIITRLKTPGALHHMGSEVYARAASPCPLTPREIFVLNELASGLSGQQVAERMQLSKKTIDSYKSKIFTKLDVQTLLQAINKCRSNGWLADQ